MKGPCKNNCGAEVEIIDDPLFSKFRMYCPVCCEKFTVQAAREEAEKKRESRESAWRSICPPAYRDTVVAKLPVPDKAPEILAWNYGAKGLLLHGPTRKGKSRCAWLLCRRVFEAGKSVRVLDAMAGFQYAAAFASNGAAAQAWVDAFCKCGLLFFDDVFKAKLTDSFEAAVFAIVEYRMSHGLPVLATLNDTGETLAARMSADRGEAIVARL